MKKQITDLFDTPDPKSDPITRKLTPEDLDMAARVAVAIERFVDENELLSAKSVIYGGNENQT